MRKVEPARENADAGGDEVDVEGVYSERNRAASGGDRRGSRVWKRRESGDAKVDGEMYIGRAQAVGRSRGIEKGSTRK